MAKSGTINGTQSGNRPYLRLKWDIRSQDVANNRSRVRLRLYIVAPYRVSYSANKKGRLSGSDFTHTSGMSGTGEKLIRTQEVWTSHNSNGSKTATYSAWYDINITYSGSYIGRLSLSGTASLDTIPRASTLSSFSMGASLKEGTANTVRLGISRKSSSFTHDVQLRMGSATIASWNGQATPSSLSLSVSQVNNMLSRMSSSTSSTVTLRVQTKSGSSNIGSAVSRTATASVSSTVVPTINDRFDISISGSGADKTMGNYIQNMSKAKVIFTSSARGGAGVSKRTVTVDGRVHNGYDITSQTLSKSGSIPVKVEITDTRGRKASKTKNISVLAYSTPAISSFRVERESGNQSRAQITYSGTSSTLSNKNKVNIRVQRQLTGGSGWTTIDSRDDSGNFNRSIVDTGASTSSSYMYRVVATDTVGGSATREQSLSTARVLLDLNADKGIGIGKMHERGALDVDGDVYFGGVRFDQIETVLPSGDGTVSYWQSISPGKYTVDPDTFTGQPHPYLFVEVLGKSSGVAERTVLAYGKGNKRHVAYIMVVNSNSSQNDGRTWKPLVADDFIVERGGDVTEGYEKWESGILKVWMRATTTVNANSYRSLDIEFPTRTISGGNAQATLRTTSGTSYALRVSRAMISSGIGTNGGVNVHIRNDSSSNHTKTQVQVEAITRWR